MMFLKLCFACFAVALDQVNAFICGLTPHAAEPHKRPVRAHVRKLFRRGTRVRAYTALSEGSARTQNA